MVELTIGKAGLLLTPQQAIEDIGFSLIKAGAAAMAVSIIHAQQQEEKKEIIVPKESQH